MSGRRGQEGVKAGGVLAAFWIVALVFCLGTLNLLDDHFGRISPGRQILAFGELPFRDFLDPGYFLTELSSAAVQRLFGPNLVGELLLNALFIATGCLLVCLLARRMTGSLPGAVFTGTMALLALPRAYDYDKVLFYPLGIWAAWRWLEQPRRGRLIVLALVVMTAGLYRYDNGVFLGLAVLAGVVAATWGDWRQLLTRAGSLIAAVAIVSAPALLFIATHGGVINAIDQAITYGVRERDRTHLSSPPRVHPGSRIVGMITLPPSQNMVRVRWASSVASAEQRQELARSFGLEAEQQDGGPERRTWRYLLPEPSTDRLRRLVNDPRVEDTDGIDRSSLVLQHPESRLLRLQRASPLMRFRVFPDLWTGDNAQSIFYYLLVLLPLASVGLLGLRWAVEDSQRRAELVLVIVLAVLLDVFILRDPFMARAGGIAGPLAVLGAWTVPKVWQAAWRLPRSHGRAPARVLTTAVALVLLWSLGTALDWPHQLNDLLATPSALAPRLRQFAHQPPDLGLLPSGRLAGMVRYLRRCTAPPDHVFISWFRPELFYFAERGFGGGISATFGSHWSEPRFQARSIAAFEAQPTPVVLLRADDYDMFRTDYPLLDAYIARRYRLAGETNFGNPEAEPGGYRVFVRSDRQAASTDQETGLPCFSEP
jgi:4-amino-4-deoxy-L-arabinose transferase-like glycosyltransferase